MPNFRFKTSYEMSIREVFRNVQEFDGWWDNPQCGLSLEHGQIRPFVFLQGYQEIEQMLALLPKSLDDLDTVILVRIRNTEGQINTGITYGQGSFTVSDLLYGPSVNPNVFTHAIVEEHYLN